jgi:hypothetical protein
VPPFGAHVGTLLDPFDVIHRVRAGVATVVYEYRSVTGDHIVRVEVDVPSAFLTDLADRATTGQDRTSLAAEVRADGLRSQIIARSYGGGDELSADARGTVCGGLSSVPVWSRVSQSQTALLQG